MSSERGVKVAWKSNQTIRLEDHRFILDRLDAFIDEICVFQVQEQAAKEKQARAELSHTQIFSWIISCDKG